MKTYTQGDTPRIGGRLAANLTAATMVVNVKRPDGTVVSAAGSVPAGEDPTTGPWTALFADSELDQVGLHGVEVRVKYANEETQTFAHDVEDAPLDFYTREAFAA